jgi:hypothetical protein
MPAYKKWNLDHSMIGVIPSGSNMKVWIATSEEMASVDRLVIENPQVS